MFCGVTFLSLDILNIAKKCVDYAKVFYAKYDFVTANY